MLLAILLILSLYYIHVVDYYYKTNHHFQEDQAKMVDKKMEDICADMGDAPKVRLSTKKLLKGHINKVNSVHYSGDSR